MVLLLCKVAVKAAKTFGLCQGDLWFLVFHDASECGQNTESSATDPGVLLFLAGIPSTIPAPWPFCSRAANRDSGCRVTQDRGKWPEFSSDIGVKSLNFSQPAAQSKSELCLCEAFSSTMHSINENFLSSSLLLSGSWSRNSPIERSEITSRM